MTLAPDALTIRYFGANPSPISQAQLDKVPSFRLLPSEERRALRSLGWEMVIPLSTSRGLVGLLFVERPRRWWRRRSPQTLAARATRLAEMLEAGDGPMEDDWSSQQDQSLEEATGGVIHQLTNCLSTILAHAQRIEEDRTVQEEVKQRIALIRQIAAGGVRSVQRLRDYLNPGQREPVDIDQMVEEVVGLMDARFQASQESGPPTGGLVVELGSRQQVMGDASQLRETLINLVANAIEAIPPQDGWVRVSTGVEGGWTYICVQDNGPGISPEDEERIFQPFFTTRGQEGMGLGLAIARSIVSRHGGWLRMERPAEGGALFKVGLPPLSKEAP